MIIQHSHNGSSRDVPDDASYFARWQLIPDGTPITTRSSRLLPVLHGGCPAMLKLAIAEEERAGGAVMAWWAGHGAAPVLAHEGIAVLLERAKGVRSLSAMARGGEDLAATAIICDTLARLHAPRPAPPPPLVPLSAWFEELGDAAPAAGGVLAAALATTKTLLADPRDTVVLHGDVHHDNILDFGPRGWLAIDPKGLRGERGFDYANLFRNPNGTVALRAGRFEEYVALVSRQAALARERLLQWILAVMGLSASWHLADNEPPATTLAIGGLAAAALGLAVS